MATFQESPWMRRSGDLLREWMIEIETVWPEAKTEPEVRAPLAMLLLDLAMGQSLSEARIDRLERAVQELQARKAASPNETVQITTIFQTVDLPVNPPTKQPVMTIDRAIAILALLLSLLQTYAAVKPDAPSKAPTPQTHEQQRPGHPEAKARTQDSAR